LEIVRNNSERLAVLVNDLLDISRIEAGRVTLSMQPLNMELIIAQAMEAFIARSESEHKPMSIEMRVKTGLPPAQGDLERTLQILDNLLENAYYYTPPNGEVLVWADLVENEIQIDIQDNGIGIPPDAQPRVFERFYRGENPFVLATSGTGLGLSIVEHLVQMHQGHIWFESSGIPGEGSKFSFTLPVFNISKESEEARPQKTSKEKKKAKKSEAI
jgi:signal transduction histidine kinase